VVDVIRTKFKALQGGLDEVMRRRWAAAEAKVLGHGGMSRVAKATGLTLPTIRRGMRELDAGVPHVPGRARSPGAGRKPLTQKDPTLLAAVEALVDPMTRGDPIRRCAGPARASGGSSRNCRRRGIQSVTIRWQGCSMPWSTAFRLPERQRKALSTPIAMPNSSILMLRLKGSNDGDSQ